MKETMRQLSALQISGLAAAILFSQVLLTGCVKVKKDDAGTPVTRVEDASTNGNRGQQQDVVIVPPAPAPSQPLFYEVIDPCAAKLQDIEGLLLKYYISYHHLPSRLEELAPMADSGQQVDFNCPLCNRTYIYLTPGGIATAGQIVAYAPVPAKDGKYRAIKMRPAAGTAMGSLPDVVSLTPEEMKPYLQRSAPK